MVLGSWAIDLSCIQSNKSSPTSHPGPICLIQRLSPYWSISLERIYSIQRAIHWQGIINPTAWTLSKITFCCYSALLLTQRYKKQPLLMNSNHNDLHHIKCGSKFKEIKRKHFSLIINCDMLCGYLPRCSRGWSCLNSNEATGSEREVEVWRCQLLSDKVSCLFPSYQCTLTPVFSISPWDTWL